MTLQKVAFLHQKGKQNSFRIKYQIQQNSIIRKKPNRTQQRKPNKENIIQSD